MTLRGALGCSAAFHFALLVSVSPLGWLPLGEAAHPLEVSYVPVQVPAPVPPAPIRSEDAGPFPAPTRMADRPDPVPAPRPALKETPPRAFAPRPAFHRVEHHWTEIAPPPLPKTSHLAQQQFAFVEHKERARRHLKARLHYPAFLSDGTVRLRVLLDPQGGLKQAVVLATSDPRLASIAIQDAQGASPYPHFPGAHRPHQVRYEFLVRYRPE